jgi:cytochrome c peroxidase
VEAKGEDLVKPRLPALRAYQHSLAKPAAAAGSFDAAAARRGRAVFAGAGKCASCHAGTSFTDGKLHAAAETGMDPAYAERSATRKYRATPLRALWQHAPYFHDGKAASLDAVVDHYDATLGLKLNAEQKKELVEYLKSI